MNKEGYLTFKVFDPSELPGLRKQFKEACKNFPEFLEVTDEDYDFPLYESYDEKEIEILNSQVI